MNDYLDEKVSIVRLSDCKKIGTIESKHRQASVKISMMKYSEFQERVGFVDKLGVVYADGSLSFFEAHDHYKFETVIERSDCLWLDYIEMTNTWITVVKSGHIQVWDLTTLKSEEWVKVLDSHLSLINDSCELARNKLYSLGTSDKKLFILDPIKRSVFKVITLNLEGINKLRYMSCFSAMVVAGYSRDIPVYEVNVKHREIGRIGLLVGHLSNIAAIEVVDNSPAVISVDDVPVVKVWDVRTFKCIQTVDFKIGTTILNLVAIPENFKFAYVSTRVNVIDLLPFFGDKFSNLLDPMNRDLILNDVVYDHKRKVFSLFGNRAILEVSVFNGLTKRLITNIFNPESQDDLGICDLLADQSLSLVSDHNGNLLVHDLVSNESILKIEGSKKELLSFDFDQDLKLLLVAGYDNSIKIYYEPQQFDLSKRSKQASLGGSASQAIVPKSIIAGIEQHSTQRFFDYSLKYDVIFSVFPNKIAVFSLDTYKLLVTIDVPATSEILSFNFDRNSGVFLLGFSTDDILVAKIVKRSFGRIEFGIVANIDLKKYLKVVNKEVNKLRIFKLAVGMLLKSLGIVYVDLNTTIHAEKILIQRLTPQFIELVKHEDDSLDSDLLVCTAQSCFVKFNVSESISKRLAQFAEKKSDILVKGSFNFGKRLLINYVEQLEYMNLEPLKLDPADRTFEITNMKLTKVFHTKTKDPKSVKIVKIGGTKYIISIFNPCYFLVLNMALLPICKLNINHPLPLTWQLKLTRDREASHKISEIKKFFTHVLIHYQPNFAKIDVDEQIKNDLLTKSVRDLVTDEDNMQLDQLALLVTELKEIEERIGKDNVRLMKDSYHPKDIVYNRIRKENLSEIAGPNLYQMERKRKFYMNHEYDVGPQTDNIQFKNLMLKHFDEEVKIELQSRYPVIKDETSSQTPTLRNKLDKAFLTEEGFYKKTAKGKAALLKKLVNVTTAVNNMTAQMKEKLGKNGKKLSTSTMPDILGKHAARESTVEAGKKEQKSTSNLHKLFDQKSVSRPSAIDESPSQSRLNKQRQDDPTNVFETSNANRKRVSIQKGLNATQNNFFIKPGGPTFRPYLEATAQGAKLSSVDISVLNERELLKRSDSQGQSQLKKTDSSTAQLSVGNKDVGSLRSTHPSGFVSSQKLVKASKHFKSQSLNMSAGRIAGPKLPRTKIVDAATTMETFLRETNNKTFRTTFGNFEVRNSDCSMIYRDKNLNTFVTNLDSKMKRAKYSNTKNSFY